MIIFTSHREHRYASGCVEGLRVCYVRIRNELIGVDSITLLSHNTRPGGPAQVYLADGAQLELTAEEAEWLEQLIAGLEYAEIATYAPPAAIAEPRP